MPYPRRLFDDLQQDLHYAVRTLPRQPGLMFGVIATLALAIGVNAAMFGLVSRLLSTAPPGVAHADRVTRAQLVYTDQDGSQFLAPVMSYPAYRALLGASGAFARAAAVRADTVALGRGAEVEQVGVIAGSGSYFDVLEAHPALGRFFSSEDDQLPAGNPVAVLSHPFWKARFAGDHGVLGRVITLQGQDYTIVGVAPRGFTGDQLAPVDVFVPLTAMLSREPAGWAGDPFRNIVGVIARLQGDVSAQAAQTPATTAVAAAWAGRNGGTPPAVRLTSLLPGRTVRASSQARIGLWLAGVALTVLLIATANVATLLLLRSLRRRREMAVRIALGVSRWRLARQLVVESMLLAALGGAAGLLVARWFGEIIRSTLIPGLAPAEGFTDGPMLMATLGSIAVAGLVGGCAPLVQLRRTDPISDLRDGPGSTAARKSFTRAALVGVQVALSTVLIVGAGLFVRSLRHVESQDLGFSPTRLLLVTLDTRANLSNPDQLYLDAAGRLASLPGVTGVTVAEALPFGFHHIPPISVPGLSEPPGMNVQLPMLYAATPEYLRMMGVKLIEGRLLTDQDGRTAPFVVLVNESMARTVWPGQSAVGKCIRIGFDPSLPPSPLAPTSLPCREVVGVVRDSRARSLIPDGREERLMQYYVPFGQLVGLKPVPNPRNVNAILVETTGDPTRLSGAVQRLIQRTASVPVLVRARPYQDLIDPQLRSWRLGATLFTAFGALALAIAAIGLFGVISYLVSQRTREIGVRLALGGRRGHVGRLVVGDTLRLAGMGTAAGLAIALLVAPRAQSLLFQTSSREPAVLLLSAALLLATAVAASLVPVWRATHVDPLIALRSE